MPPRQGDVINPFNQWEFQRLVNKDVPEDMIKILQQEYGDDVTGGASRDDHTNGMEYSLDCNSGGPIPCH